MRPNRFLGEERREREPEGGSSTARVGIRRIGRGPTSGVGVA